MSSPEYRPGMTRVLCCLISIQTVILLAAIPWAYSIQGRLTGVETALQGFIPGAQLVAIDVHNKLEKRVVRLEVIQELAREKGPAHDPSSIRPCTAR